MMTIFDVLCRPLLIGPLEVNGKDVSDWEFEDDGRFGIGYIFVREPPSIYILSPYLSVFLLQDDRACSSIH